MTYKLLESDSAVVLDRADAAGCVIWLHGLGADGSDFVPMVPQLQLPDSLKLRFVFPNARIRPVTLNNGHAMRAWYDIYSLTREGRSDEPGMNESVAQIHALIQAQVDTGIQSQRIVIAGFSQGGAVALHAALSSPWPLAGVVVTSTYLPLADPLESRLTVANKGLSIFMGHGDHDEMVTQDLGKDACEWLEEHGYQVEWESYPMAHELCLKEIHDIAHWLKARLSPS